MREVNRVTSVTPEAAIKLTRKRTTLLSKGRRDARGARTEGLALS